MRIAPKHACRRGPARQTIVVANPSFDLYGADLQMVESVAALVAARHDVLVTSPTDGPLRRRLQAVGARCLIVRYPVLRRADASPDGLARLALSGSAAVVSYARLLRRQRAAAVYVNTLTLPWCLAGARLARVPAMCHVHEAEPDVGRRVARAMSTPLLMARRVVANSAISLRFLCESQPRLRARTVLVYNGVPGPPDPPDAARFDPDDLRLLFVGRLSARKAPLVALETTAQLRHVGHNVRLTVAGTAVTGQETYEHELRQRAAQPDLAGAVDFPGYVSPVWPLLAVSDILLATSTAEPFGNTVVEAQLARRPVVATALEGHLETVKHGETGMHVDVGDVDGFAAAVTALLADPQHAQVMADRGQRSATERFGSEQYAETIVAIVAGLLPRLR